MNPSKLISPLRKITLRKPNASILLFVAAVTAVILANCPLSADYYGLLNYPIHLEVGNYEFFQHGGHTMTLLQFVNDALMVLFFFVVGLEIKQEMLVGELSSVRKAILPIVGALGGMVVPVLFYLLICPTGDAARGAAIPMATDIAFALAVLSMLKSKLPICLKAFLTALAVVDDIGGIIVIAVAYSSHISFLMLAIALGIIGLMYVAGKRGVRASAFYYLGGFIVWILFMESGVHATIAGVLVAMIVPARSKVDMKNLRTEMRILFNLMPSEERTTHRAVVLSHTQISVLASMKRKAASAISPVQTMESALTPFVNYFVLPLFAFVNAGVTLGGVTPEALLSVPLAILLGLSLGKMLGIFSFTYLFVRFGSGRFPQGMTTNNLLPLSLIGGIGFTVSLFLASLSFGEAQADLFNQAKLGIFCGSIVSGVGGYFWLRKVLIKESLSTPIDVEKGVSDAHQTHTS